MAEFRVAKARVENLRVNRSQVYHDLQRRDRLVTAMGEHRHAMSIASARVTAAKEDLSAAERVESEEASTADHIAQKQQRQKTKAAWARMVDAEGGVRITV